MHKQLLFVLIITELDSEIKKKGSFVCFLNIYTISSAAQDFVVFIATKSSEVTFEL